MDGTQESQAITALKEAVAASDHSGDWQKGNRWRSKSWRFPLETRDGWIHVWPILGGYQIALVKDATRGPRLLTNCVTAKEAVSSAERFSAGVYRLGGDNARWPGSGLQ